MSWDNYPAYDTPWSMVAMTHDLMRGLKDEPFMLMEQTPSQQNWQHYNSLKRPGQMRAQSYQTIAHGADTIQFFQLRRSKGGCEKFHGAVIAHVGTNDTRYSGRLHSLDESLKASAQGHLAHAISQMWESSLTGTITGHLSTQADLHRTLNMLTRFTTIMSIFTTKISLLI